jgi:hypothetical protein
MEKVRYVFENSHGYKLITNIPYYTHYQKTTAEAAAQLDLGDPKIMYYVTGNHYQMGFLLGQMAPQDIEALCTTFINHLAPQFFSAELDLAMRDAPILYQGIYEFLLHELSDYIIEETNACFEESVKCGDIPQQYVDELRGILDGCSSKSVITPVTYKRLVAANYGVDFLITKVFSGEWNDTIKALWQKMPGNFPYREEYVGVPDMCNGFMVGPPATKGKVYLARDFQFMNAHVYQTCCTIIVRQPQNGILHAAVSLPGLLGALTGLNIHGVSLGVNMVRSAAVDTQRLGMGCILTTRHLLEKAENTKKAEHLLRQTHHGCPWLFYGADASGDMRTWEIIATKWDAPKYLKSGRWTTKQMQKPTQAASHRDGVYHRGHQDDGIDFKYRSYQQEMKRVKKVGNMYFPPYRSMKGVEVINNSFLTPTLRYTQMTPLMNRIEAMSYGNQWRYDRLCQLIRKHYGSINLRCVSDIICFLSPWNEPNFPQNRRPEYLGIPSWDDFLRDFSKHYVNPLASVGATRTEVINEGVMMTGSITVIDVHERILYNKHGFWGLPFYSLDLRDFLRDFV